MMASTGAIVVVNQKMYDTDGDDSDEISILPPFIPAIFGSYGTASDPSDGSKDVLLWRFDKDDSFSDWTIGNKAKGNNFYYVHKNKLGAGPNKSGYFQAIFKSGRFSESDHSSSEFQLSSSDAEHFPDFLDFFYSRPSECAPIVNRENRRSLQKLAEYFLVPKLTEAANAFIEQDIETLEHMEEYVVEFSSSEDDDSRKFLRKATNTCAEMILYVERNSSLLKTLTPAMMLIILRKIKKSNLPDTHKQHIFGLANDYLDCHREHLDECYFVALTSELEFSFPENARIGAEVAIELLRVMKVTGWKNSTVQGTCRRLLSQHLANDRELTWDEIHQITSGIPEDVLRVLFVESLAVKRDAKAEEIHDVTCNFIYRNKTVKSTKVFFLSTDSVYCILQTAHYRCGIYLEVEATIVFEGEKLSVEESAAHCAILSNSVLNIECESYPRCY
ncbi:hypothetical protein ACHAWF_012564 [Thalassiosira exigua]